MDNVIMKEWGHYRSLKYDQGLNVMILHVPVYMRLNEDEGDRVMRTNWRSSKQRLIFFLFKRINM
jgi:hypothetical protein